MRPLILAFLICAYASHADAQFKTDVFRASEPSRLVTMSICGVWGWLTSNDIHAAQLAAAVAISKHGATPVYANDLLLDANLWWEAHTDRMEEPNLANACRQEIVAMHEQVTADEFVMRYSYGNIVDRYQDVHSNQHAFADSMNSGVEFGLLCKGSSATTVFIAWPKEDAFLYVPIYRPMEIYDKLVKRPEVLIAYRGPDRAANYKASVTTAEFMYEIGFRSSLMSDDYEVETWYIDRTTGGLGSFTPSNASNNPDMKCNRLEADELATRLNDLVRVQFSNATELFEAAIALHNEKKSKLKF